MPTAKPSDPQSKKDRVMKERMGAFKAGEMHSGTGKPGIKVKSPVTNPKQAIAIALSESGQSKRKSKRSSSRSSSRR